MGSSLHRVMISLLTDSSGRSRKNTLCSMKQEGGREGGCEGILLILIYYYYTKLAIIIVKKTPSSLHTVSLYGRERERVKLYNYHKESRLCI